MLDETRKATLQQLFADGCELAPTERPAFIAKACQADHELGIELAELLQVVTEDLDDFLVHPAAVLPKTIGSSTPTIAGYHDLVLIGEGGMGNVYRAHQSSPVQRVVAIKAIRMGLDSRQVLARFDAEREALARMAHPYIATVHGAGRDEANRPFLVMEFVDGLPINEYCASKGLDLNARLALFAKVCDAIDHAHRRGILHRDLKPTNVLVVCTEDQPMPKVIDFGIAKAIEGSLGENSMHTMQGSLLGTPEYMSPEQINGDSRSIDTRTDVYSLGAMLYELLAGERPFDSERLRAAGITGMARIVRDEVPPKPSTRVRRRANTLASNPDQAPTTHMMGRLHGDVD